jgi:hypothetical protein
LDVIDKYRDDLSYVLSEPDDGIYNAMNKGAAVAGGDYLIFMNSGDCFASEHVLQEVQSFCKGSDIVFGYVVTPKGVVKKKLATARFEPLSYLATRTLPHQATFMRREIFQRLGGFDESFRIVADYELFVRAARLQRASFRYIPICISIYDETGISATAVEAWRAEKKLVQNIWFADVQRDVAEGDTQRSAAPTGWMQAVSRLFGR